MSEDGELVESGSFRVDRQKALEKLVNFRRRDVGSVMLFARCAAAGGASRLDVDDASRAITLRFDGKAFSRAELVDPYAALFGEEGAEARLRWLALALVHAWRPSLSSLAIVSGAPGERVRLTASGFGAERVDRDESGETETVVALELARSDDAHWRHPIPAEMIHCRPRSHLWGRMEVVVSRGGAPVSRVAPAEPGPGELVFDDDGVRGHLSIPPDGSEWASLDAYLHGVYAGRLTWRDPRAPVVGKVDDPGLSLDASLAAVVHNDRRERLEALVRRKTDALILKVAREQGARMAETAKRLRSEPRLRGLWVQRLEGAEVEARRAGGLLGRLRSWFGSSAKQDSEVFHDACATAWLRELASEFSARRPDAADSSLAAAVDAVPLAFDGEWRPVGYAELRAARREQRLSLVKAAGARGRPGTLAVWDDGSPARFWERLKGV